MKNIMKKIGTLSISLLLLYLKMVFLPSLFSVSGIQNWSDSQMRYITKIVKRITIKYKRDTNAIPKKFPDYPIASAPTATTLGPTTTLGPIDNIDLG